MAASAVKKQIPIRKFTEVKQFPTAAGIALSAMLVLQQV